MAGTATEFQDPNGEPPVTPPPVKEEKAKEETVTIPKAQWEAALRERSESGESARYWASIARSGRPAEAAAEEREDVLDAREFVTLQPGDEGPTDDTPEKLVDEFAAQGLKALYKRGIPTKAEVKQMVAEGAMQVAREMIGRERQKITADTQIITEFPELRDPKSELFKETAELFNAAVAMDPNVKKTPAALMLAARAAKAILASKAPARVEQEADEDEVDRRGRVASQDSRPSGRREVVDDDMLGDEAKAIISQMGISEEEYKASQKQLNNGRSREGRR